MLKYSKPDFKTYKIHDVNKKILAKAPRIHLEHEFLGPQNKYQDEDYEIYQQKKKEFYAAAEKYHNLNKAALLNNKSKLDMFSDGLLKYYSECECLSKARSLRCNENEQNTTGLLLRKRTERHIHEENIEQVDVCSLEPWFKRYLKLCKFIYAARIIVLKNRLLRNLDILKQLDEESVKVYEAGHRICDNVSYADIFEKFISLKC